MYFHKIFPFMAPHKRARRTADPAALIDLIRRSTPHFQQPRRGKAQDYYESAKALEIMEATCLEKFKEDHRAREALRATGRRYILLCSPDPYWGVGEDHADPEDISVYFPGCNWYGTVLMSVRDALFPPPDVPPQKPQSADPAPSSSAPSTSTYPAPTEFGQFWQKKPSPIPSPESALDEFVVIEETHDTEPVSDDEATSPAGLVIVEQIMDDQPPPQSSSTDSDNSQDLPFGTPPASRSQSASDTKPPHARSLLRSDSAMSAA
jgi:predicted NAD-dependent protein-ADP-ribosyltransferase YbiA (DUF1768 family)